MSGLYLECYLNNHRPILQQPAVKDLPLTELGPEISAELQASLKVNVSDGSQCAASARLWETLLENRRIPYLLLRVADMRFALGSMVTAVPLYQELQLFLHDRQLEAWLNYVFDALTNDMRELSDTYSSFSSFSACQLWRSAANDTFPSCKLPSKCVKYIRGLWDDLNDPTLAMPRYLNICCLQTNLMEGVLRFNEYTTVRLLKVGFNEGIEEDAIIGGSVRNVADALSILQDTHRAMNEIITLVSSGSFLLTVETICHLHRILMNTSRVLFVGAQNKGRISYVNAGITRGTTCANVTVAGYSGMHLQFCPYDQVDEELHVFCERFNKLIALDDVDPFVAAAWVTHVFITIHPFDDGNGRLSRILASIPLLKHGLPPLCIRHSDKLTYNLSINRLRAVREGNYQHLIYILYMSTQRSLINLRLRINSGFYQ
ncbi:fido domain-containing protein [Amanita rubescens]|nr:fido domain-containing protein [Amanita rubescens]